MEGQFDTKEFRVELMTKCKIPKQIPAFVTDPTNGWDTINEIYFSFQSEKSGWEDTVKKMVLSQEAGLNLTAENWKHHKITGFLRRVWSEVESMVEQEAADKKGSQLLRESRTRRHVYDPKRQPYASPLE